MTAPAIIAAMPPTNKEIVLFVGEPVKKRETFEPTEFDESMP